MLIATQNAEEKAVNYIENISIEHKAAWRAIHYKGNYYTESNTDINGRYKFIRIVSNMIKQIVPADKYEYGVFFCNDGDVFIVALGISKPIIEKITASLEHMSNPAVDDHKVYDFFDFSVRFQEFKTLCKSKFDVVEAKRIKEEEAEKNVEPTEAEYLQRIHFNKEAFKEEALERLHRTRLKIMVVDDDDFSRKLIIRLMKSRGQIVTSADGYDALETYMYNAPDIIFLDIELPKINGQTVLKKIIEYDPRAFVVMISGYGYKSNVIEAMQRGAKGFVGKPFSKERVLSYLEACRRD